MGFWLVDYKLLRGISFNLAEELISCMSYSPAANSEAQTDLPKTDPGESAPTEESIFEAL